MLRRKRGDECPFCRKPKERVRAVVPDDYVPLALHQVVVAQRDMLERELDALRKEVARLQPISID